MQKLLTSKVAANNLKKNQLSFNTAMRAFASGPQKNPFDKVKTSMGNSQFYKLPSLGDNRLSKLLPLPSLPPYFRLPPLLRKNPARVGCQKLRRIQRPRL